MGLYNHQSDAEQEGNVEWMTNLTESDGCCSFVYLSNVKYMHQTAAQFTVNPNAIPTMQLGLAALCSYSEGHDLNLMGMI